MNRLRRPLSMFALLAAVAGCSGAGAGSNEVAPAGGPNQAEARVESLNLARREGYGLVRAPELERYLNIQADQILQVAGRPDLDVEVRVAAAVDFNASAHPGDLIRVSVGMLEDTKSEDELVFWLAHEVAHLVEVTTTRVCCSSGRSRRWPAWDS